MRKLWGSDPDVHYLDRGTEVTSSKCINLYTLNMCSFWYVKDISIKIFKKIADESKMEKKKRGGWMNNSRLGNWY